MAKPIQLYNNMLRKKVPFSPIKEGKVLFYSCGPTTYDFLHVGNARALVVGDLFHRVFDSMGYDVTFVRNFTDVDDKIIEKANELGVDPLEHSDRFIKECQKDMEFLGMKEASFTPKVSETMDEIIEMIEGLIDKEKAYVLEGEVFFHVPSFKEYGKLSRKKLDELQHGRRVQVDKRKKNGADFVLWKPAKEGEPSWDSPWGKGRPGWHIECSAMAKKYLGETIDLHHGGVDLMFPHHENEIAQSECANGCEFSKNWCHNEFLNFGLEKMSKSLGNVITIRSFVESFGGEVLRHVLSSVHYRSKMDWTQEVIEKAISEMERIHVFVQNMKDTVESEVDEESEKHLLEVDSLLEKMKNELSDDFNIPGALSSLFSLIRMINREYFGAKKEGDKIFVGKSLRTKILETITFLEKSTGLVYENPESILSKLKSAKKSLSGTAGLDEEEIEELVKERTAARQNKDWAKSDLIRDELKSKGVILRDNPDGTVSWTFK